MQKDVNYLHEHILILLPTGTPKYYAFLRSTTLLSGRRRTVITRLSCIITIGQPALTAGADSGTTWLSDNAPNALLYGSLVEAYIYMKGEQDMLQMYEKQFAEALSRIKDLAGSRETAMRIAEVCQIGLGHKE